MATASTKTSINEKSDWNQSDEDDNWEDWGDDENNVIENANREITTSTKEYDNDNEHVRNTTTKNGSNAKTQSPNATKQSKSVDDINEQTADTKSSWGLWGGKLTSVLTTATEGLGTITSSVNQGLNQIIGVPDPEELARINAAEKEAIKTKLEAEPTDQSEEQQKHATNTAVPAAFGLSLVSGVTTLGSKVINTGLDTLEGIGKKTMTILQENDPKLMNKRKLLGFDADKPNLSALLQEAKQDADEMEQSLRQLEIEKTRAQLRFELIFENNCGLVHYEALEILSKESNLKLQTLLESVSGNALSELQETINEVKELLELESIELENEGDYDAAELRERLTAAIADADIQISFDDIINNWSASLEWLNSTEASDCDVQQAFAKSINALSECCALEICKLHKIAELLLVKQYHSTANEVDSIAQLCRQFNGHLQGLTNRYASLLSNKSSEETDNDVSTLFAEMLVAAQYIEKAYKLFIPILQMGAV